MTIINIIFTMNLKVAALSLAVLGSAISTCSVRLIIKSDNFDIYFIFDRVIHISKKLASFRPQSFPTLKMEVLSVTSMSL